MNKVKIVCTLGLNSSTVKHLKQFKKEGMDLVRLNSSHGSIPWIKKTIYLIRRCLPDTPILVDLPGTKIRVKNLKNKKYVFENDEIIFTCDDQYKGDKKIILNNKDVYKKVRLNSKIFAEDGNLIFKVLKKKDRDIFCKVLEKGYLSDGKGISFNLKTKKKIVISDNELNLIRFLRKIEPDFVGISNSKNGSHITKIKKILKKENIKIVAKIEDSEGLKNLENILKVTDAIMVDRGDLSSSSDIINIATTQKDIIKISKKYGKPTIIATELLSSMIDKKIPSKSEVVDITNAVFDGCSATMLSNETVLGKNPHLIIREMRKIINSALKHQSKKEHLFKKNSDISEAICRSVVDICRNLSITKIIVITKTGYAARLLSFYNLKQKVYAITNCRNTARSYNLIKGTEGIYLNINFFQESTEHIRNILKKLYKIKKINNKDLIAVVAVGYPKKGNKMNLIQLHKVEDLKKVFKW